MVKSQAASIRAIGYDGPLTLGVMHTASKCYVLQLLAFKNMESRLARLELQPLIGGVRYVLCLPVSAHLAFFVGTLRQLLEPKENHPFAPASVWGRPWTMVQCIIALAATVRE